MICAKFGVSTYMETLLRFQHKDGKYRNNGLERICPVCSTTFVTRADQPSTTCGTRCRGVAARNRVEVKCAQCGKDFELPLNRIKIPRSGLHFCCRLCKDTAQRIGGIKEIQPAHYGTGPEDYRAKFAPDELVCKRCGYDEFSVSVQIHHIDHNRENNDRDNLMPLCANCHWALHNNKWFLSELSQPTMAA